MQSLPISSIEEIFSRMSVTYGAAWAQMWTGVDPASVKQQWAEELGGFLFRPEAIHHALEHLPVDRPPNSLQFKVICLHAPTLEEAQPAKPKLNAPKPDISRLRAAFIRFKELRAELRKKPLHWAYTLQKREAAGERLTEQQRRDWREAIAHAQSAQLDSTGLFRAIEPESLPPGMRSDHVEKATRSAE